MRQELIQCNRDFGYCVTIRALPCYGDYWSRYCNSYRNNPDSKGNWETLLKTYESYFPYVNPNGEMHTPTRVFFGGIEISEVDPINKVSIYYYPLIETSTYK
jgi:hypothetical protein